MNSPVVPAETPDEVTPVGYWYPSFSHGQWGSEMGSRNHSNRVVFNITMSFFLAALSSSGLRESAAQDVPPQPEPATGAAQPDSSDTKAEPTAPQTKPISDIKVSIKNKSEIGGQKLTEPVTVALPKKKATKHSTGKSRDWGLIAYQWTATGYAHSPLYFEEVNLERYGNEAEFPFMQPVLSGMHFYLHVPAMPYIAALEKPWEEKYVLGQYRPGNWAPFQVDVPPLDWNAAAFAGAFYTGFAFVIP